MKPGGPFRVHKRAPLNPILSQPNPPQLTSSRSVLILLSLLCPSLSMVSVLQMSQSKSCMHFSCLPKREIYSARHFLWPFFLQTFGTQYALWNFLLCSLLRLPVSNPILGPTTSARFTYSRCSDQATGWTIRGLITGTRRNFLFFANPDLFTGPPSLLSNGYRGVFSESDAAGMCK
jgi:hypothetical protein